MQSISLKEGFKDIFTTQFLDKISQENEFIFLDSNELNISYNLDKDDMYGSPLGDDENEFFEVISELEKKFEYLTPFFTDDFEITYFTYNGEYTISMWSFKNGKLSSNSGWIGDFCPHCDDIDDEEEREEARDNFVDENYQSIKDGYTSDEILEKLRKGLYEL